MPSSTYISNSEIASYMDGYIKQSKESGSTASDESLISAAADAAAQHYRTTARVTFVECMGYYLVWKGSN